MTAIDHVGFVAAEFHFILSWDTQNQAFMTDLKASRIALFGAYCQFLEFNGNRDLDFYRNGSKAAYFD